MRANSLHRGYGDPSYLGPLRARPTGVRAALGMGVGAWVILCAAALVIHTPADTQSAADIAPAPASGSAKIASKIDAVTQAGASPKTLAFDIDAPEYQREKKSVSLGEPGDGAPRVDSLTIGQFAMGAPFIRIDVHQDLDPAATNPDFFLDMTRHAKAAGLNVTKIGQRAPITTRFGAFETADIRLSQPGGEGVDSGERACLATRFVDARTPLEIAGIACGAATRPIDRAALGCLLDKVSYSAGGDNKTLNDFFFNAELARVKDCASVSGDDVTGSIPPHKATRTKAASHQKKTHAVARSAPVHPEAAKN